MIKKQKENLSFKAECFPYLLQFNIRELRSYGRYLQLRKPTCLKKVELINEIINVLCGEQEGGRLLRGAPPKHNAFPAEIPTIIETLKEKYKEEIEIEQNQKEGEDKLPSLQFCIVIDRLNKKQKQLLNDFLNSL